MIFLLFKYDQMFEKWGIFDSNVKDISKKQYKMKQMLMTKKILIRIILKIKNWGLRKLKMQGITYCRQILER